MKKLLFVAILFSGKLVAQTPLYQNTNENIWVGNSAACTTTGPGTIHNNGFMRVFDTDNFGIQDTAFFVNIEFAVQECSGGAYNLIGRVYKLDGTLLLANMTLIEDDTAATYPDSSVYRMKIPFDAGYALPGDTLVTEVFAPLNGSIIFFPGSNPYLETGPSYIIASGCGLTEPSTYASIGFTDVKLILKLWVNQKPNLNAVSYQVFKDNTLNLSKSEFDASMIDFDSDTLTMIRIESLPTNGVLKLNTVALNVGDTVEFNEFNQFTYTPNSGYFGADNFTVKVKDNHHWSNSTSDINVDVINWQVSIDESEIDFKVYPNPTTGIIELNDVIQYSQYTILTMQGKILSSGNTTTNNMQIDLDIYPEGNYIIQLSNDEVSNSVVVTKQ